MTDGAGEEIQKTLKQTFKSERNNQEITERILNIAEKIKTST